MGPHAAVCHPHAHPHRHTHADNYAHADTDPDGDGTYNGTTTVEVSVYVHHEFRSKGIGSKLLEWVTLEGKKVGNHTVLSRISQGNESSIHIHEKYGYRHVGVMKEVGFKFGKFLDVHMM